MSLLSPLLRDKGGSTLTPFVTEKPVHIDLDHSPKYFFIFLILGAASALLLSNALVAFHGAPAANMLFSVAGYSSIFLLVLIFQTLMIRSTQFNVILVALEAALLPAFFYTPFTPWIVIGTSLFFAGWFLHFQHARAVLNDAMRVHFWQYSTVMITGAVTALALFLSCIYVGFYQQRGGITFNAYKFVVSGAAPGVQYVAPNFTPETKVDAFLDEAIAGYFSSQKEFTQLSSGARQQALRETTTGIRDKLTELTKVDVAPSETVASYTFRWMSETLQGLQQKGYGGLVLVSLFFIVYFGLKGVLFFMKWPVLFVAFLLYLLLQAVGIISVASEMRQKEVLVLK
jgi:hypothetical protein